MKFLFGKSAAAMTLERIVETDELLRAKVMRHLSDYNHYVKVVSTIPDREVRARALSASMECNLTVPTIVKTLIRNIKVAKRREALLK